MSRELTVSIITTLIGTVVASFLLFIGKTHPVIATSALFVLVALIVALVNYQASLLLMLKSPGNYDIGGNWKTTWSYEKTEGRVDIVVTLNLRQIGQHIKGLGQSIEIRGPAPFNMLIYEMRGRVKEDGIVQGEWRNLNPGMHYYGTFQAKVAPHGKKVDGVWVGFDSDGVRHGTYISERT